MYLRILYINIYMNLSSAVRAVRTECISLSLQLGFKMSFLFLFLATRVNAIVGILRSQHIIDAVIDVYVWGCINCCSSLCGVADCVEQARSEPFVNISGFKFILGSKRMASNDDEMPVSRMRKTNMRLSMAILLFEHFLSARIVPRG